MFFWNCVRQLLPSPRAATCHTASACSAESLQQSSASSSLLFFFFLILFHTFQCRLLSRVSPSLLQGPVWVRPPVQLPILQSYDSVSIPFNCTQQASAHTHTCSLSNLWGLPPLFCRFLPPFTHWNSTTCILERYLKHKRAHAWVQFSSLQMFLSFSTPGVLFVLEMNTCYRQFSLLSFFHRPTGDSKITEALLQQHSAVLMEAPALPRSVQHVPCRPHSQREATIDMQQGRDELCLRQWDSICIIRLWRYRFTCFTL